MKVSIRAGVFIYTSTIFIIAITLFALLFNVAFIFDINDIEMLLTIDNNSLTHFRNIVNITLLFIAVTGEVIIFIISSTIANKFNKVVNKLENRFINIISEPYSKKVIYTGNIKEIDDVINATNKLLEKLEKRDAVRSEIASDYAHEFRTSLTLLLSNLEAVSDGIFKPTKELIDSCKVEVIRLNDMSEYLYKIADVERFKFSIEKRRVNLSKVIKSILPSFNEYAKLKSIRINAKLGNYICYADVARVQSIIINLVMNAIKFSYNDSEININLFKKSDNILKLTVEDNGVGIVKEDLSHIFKFGYRSRRKDGKRINGNGIGLSIVKTLVVAHGWRISVKTKVKVGTTFTVTIVEKRK